MTIVRSENAPTVQQLCGNLTRGLCEIAIRTEQHLAAPRTHDNEFPDWLQALAEVWSDGLANCEAFAQAFSEHGIDTEELAEVFAEIARAFAAPSLLGTEVTRPAISLLLERLFALLSAAFAFVRKTSQQQGFEPLATAAASFELTLLPRSSSRSPSSSPAAYRKRLLIFAYLATRPDLLDDLGDGQADDLVQRVTSRPITVHEMHEPRSFRGADRQFSHALEKELPSLEFSTPVLRPERTALENPLERTYRVWYGTDRSPLRPDDPALGFSGTMDDRLHFGSCLVFVPRSHDEGSIGSSWIRRTFIKRADDRLKLTLIRPLTRDSFQSGVAQELHHRETPGALIYLHGFRVSFKEAALRAAQLGCDLGVAGITAFYSWASAGKLKAYSKDEETVRLTVEHFVEFLETLLCVNGLERADIIAHSMGNRILASVIARLASSKVRPRIGHLVLAAPDIARSEFNKVATYYGAVASKRTTLYSCAKDRALAASTNRHDYLRIGYEPPVYSRAGIDTISASRIKLDLLGHGYVGSARPVIADLKSLLWEDLPPAQRQLDPVPDQRTAEYWLLRR